MPAPQAPLLNPVLFAILDGYIANETSTQKLREETRKRATREPIPDTALSDHVVLLGWAG